MRYLVAILFLALAIPAVAAPKSAMMGDTVSRRDLAGEWLFTDGVKDFSGNGLVGSLVNSASVSDDSLLLTGSDYMSVAHADVIDFSSSDAFSISAWVNPASFQSAADMIVAKASDENCQGYMLSFISVANITNGLRFNLRQKSPRNITIDTGHDIPTGKWTHVCATYNGNLDASGSRIYINVVTSDYRLVVINDIYKNPTINNTAALEIGARAGGKLPFDGRIDGVRIDARELTSAEVFSLYLKGHP